MADKSKLRDMVDFERLQELQDAFAAAAKVTTVILDPEGRPITTPSDPYGFCERLRGHPQRDTLCLPTGEKLVQKTRKAKGPVRMVCPHSGFTVAAAPIVADGFFLGGWSIGPVRLNTPGGSAPTGKRALPGVAQQAFEELAAGLPQQTEEEFEEACTFLQALTGALLGMASHIDTTRKDAMRDELASLAFYDRGTGLPNSLKMMQDLSAPSGGEHTLVCYDLQGLRTINEAYGREAGDLLLQATAQWVAGQNFGNEGLYRIGGDEFGMVFAAGADGQRQMKKVAKTLYERFGQAWVVQLQGEKLPLLCGVSVAVIRVTKGPVDDELVNRVERALDASKRRGRVVVYDQAMEDAFASHLQLEVALRDSVKNGMRGFDVHFQPIVDPSVGTWKGMEALCRWTRPDNGEEVPPLVFIREAEQMGLMDTIGMYVLEMAISTAKRLRLDGVEGFFLSVNVSPPQLLDAQFGSKVMKLLRRYDFPGRCLALEVTESTEFVFSGKVMDTIDKLRFQGVRFSLDDFGTGYSSFKNLKNLPVSLLKTEREFIIGIEDDNYMQYFFYSITELAHAADMRLIAEGIETHEQLAVVLKNDVDYLQGYLFSTPLPAAELEARLDAFTQVAPVFYEIRQPGVSQQIFSGRNAWLSSPKLFNVLNQSVQILLSRPALDAAISEVLALCGATFKAACGYVFLKRPQGGFGCAYAWNVPFVHAPRWEDAVPGALEKAWLPRLLEDGMMVASDVARLDAEVQALLQVREAKALAVLPMYDEEELVGFIGFESREYHEWLPEEVTLMGNLGMTMAGSLKKERLQAEVQQNDMRFTDVLNHMDLGIMLTDPDTDEILWANDTLAKMYQVQGPFAGHHCYEALYHRKARCENCNVPTLMDNPLLRQCQAEIYNERSGRWLMVTNSLVQWERGRKVHLQYAFDITDVKTTQKKLEHFANTDTMTGAFNRSSLIQAMERLLAEANESGEVLSIVFVDIDRLKMTNDTFGHNLGDELICATVDMLRRNIRNTDVIGRYGGDEFIVLMQNCPLAKAEKNIERARRSLAKKDIVPGAEAFTFSYGVVESAELPYEEGDRMLNALINLADDRMRDHKKKHRAGRAGAGEDEPAMRQDIVEDLLK